MSLNSDNERGRRAEYRVLHLLQTGASWMPPWYKEARLANPEEDKAGYDLVVKIDLGPMRLQVKAGRLRPGFEAGHRGYYERKGILVIPYVSEMPKEELKVLLRSSITNKREEILAKRRALPKMRSPNV